MTFSNCQGKAVRLTMQQGETVHLSAKMAHDMQGSLATGGKVCWHFPDDQTFAPNECQLRINSFNANSGKEESWTIEGGNHNIPKEIKFDHILVSGKGCMVLTYNEENQK